MAIRRIDVVAQLARELKARRLSVRETLRDLEAQAKVDTDAVEQLNSELKSPVRLPTAEALADRAQDLEKIFAAEPVRAREALRGLFEHGAGSRCIRARRAHT